MRNIKSLVYKALSGQFGKDRVTDQYPKSWENLPAVQYTEEDNRVSERSTEGEEKAYVRYRIDIWDNRNTSEPAQAVDDVLGCTKSGMEKGTTIGLSRTMCQDAPDPSGLKHKVMRYEAIIDAENDELYWENNT